MDIKAQRFGIEVELTGITRKAAADIAAAYFGTTARAAATSTTMIAGTIV